MAFLSEQDRRRIEDAIAAAEMRTSAELVTVIARESASYLYLPTLAAATLTFVLSGLALLLPLDFGHAAFYGGQVVGFAALMLCFHWPPIKMLLVPRALKQQRARVLAHAQFLDLGLSSTRNRTGVMLFVSVAERYVEIIADVGVDAHVEDGLWQRIVADFVGSVRAGRIADGFVTAIEACTTAMAATHPWTTDDVNELPNRLVEI